MFPPNNSEPTPEETQPALAGDSELEPLSTPPAIDQDLLDFADIVFPDKVELNEEGLLQLTKETIEAMPGFDPKLGLRITRYLGLKRFVTFANDRLFFHLPPRDEIYNDEKKFQEFYKTREIDGDRSLTARYYIGGLGTTGQYNWNEIEDRLRLQEVTTLKKKYGYKTVGAFARIDSIPHTRTWAEAANATGEDIILETLARIEDLVEKSGGPIDAYGLSTGSTVLTISAHISPHLFRSLTLISEANRLESSSMQDAVQQALRYKRANMTEAVWQPENRSVQLIPDELRVISASVVDANPPEFAPQKYLDAPCYQFMPANIFAVLEELMEYCRKNKPEKSCTIPTIRMVDPDDKLISSKAIYETHKRSIAEFSLLKNIDDALHNGPLGPKRDVMYGHIREFRIMLTKALPPKPRLQILGAMQKLFLRRMSEEPLHKEPPYKENP